MFSLFNRVPEILPVELSSKIEDDVGFIDVRTPEEFITGHAQGTQNIPLNTLAENIDHIRKFREVYVICQSGARSARGVQYLISQGIKAINVSGGTLGWKSSGLPIE